MIGNLTQNPQKEKISNLSKIFTILLILIPIINQYKILFLSFFDIFCIIFSGVYLIKNRWKCRIGAFAGYYCLLVFGVLSSSIFYNETIANCILSSIRLIVIYVAVFLASKEFISFNYLKSLYVRIAIFISLSIFLQIILFYVFNKPTFLIIPNLTLNYNGGVLGIHIINSLKMSVHGGYIFRPMSIFLEPAYCAYYLVPVVILLLFSGIEMNKRILLNALLITGAIVLTTSMVGIISVSFVWLFFLIKGRKYLNKKTKKLLWLFFVPIFIIFMLLFNSDAVLFSISRKFSQLENVNNNSSTVIRLFRGMDFFINMRPIDMLLGSGFGHLEDYYFKYKLFDRMTYIIPEISYMSSIFSILCSSGVVGLILYLKGLIVCYRGKEILPKVLVAILCLFLFAGSIMDFPSYYILIAMIICYKKK